VIEIRKARQVGARKGRTAKLSELENPVSHRLSESQDRDSVRPRGEWQSEEASDMSTDRGST
jgi:hypothetical protein